MPVAVGFGIVSKVPPLQIISLIGCITGVGLTVTLLFTGMLAHPKSVYVTLYKKLACVTAGFDKFGETLMVWVVSPVAGNVGPLHKNVPPILDGIAVNVAL